jgi:hypothetical protein
MGSDHEHGEGEELSQQKMAAWLRTESARTELAAYLRVCNVIGEISRADREGIGELDWLAQLRRDLGGPPLWLARGVAQTVVESVDGIERDDAVRLAYGAGARTGRALTEREVRERDARRAASDHE